MKREKVNLELTVNILNSFCINKRMKFTWEREEKARKRNIGIAFMGNLESGIDKIINFLIKCNHAYIFKDGVFEEERKCIVTKKYLFNLLDSTTNTTGIENPISKIGLSEILAIFVSAHTYNNSSMPLEEINIIRYLAHIAYGMNIKQIILVVNHMDAVNYSREIYEEIVGNIEGILLTKIGYKRHQITYIPVSGEMGKNIVSENSIYMKWYKGLSLLGTLEAIRPPIRKLILI